MKTLALTLLAAFAFAHAQPPNVPPTLNPARTWLFAVSTVVWKFDHGGDFPKKGRHDGSLVATLQARGVPEGHIVFLKDQEGTLARIKESFVALLDRTRPGDTLIFY